MKEFIILWVIACLLALTFANPPQTHMDNDSDNLRPSLWLTPSELENLPTTDQMTFEKLEKMPVEIGAKLMQKWYHVSQINKHLVPSFMPTPSNIPVFIFKSNGDKETAKLNNFVAAAKEETSFGNKEVTIFITGLPSTTESVKNANHKLIKAYIERYNRKAQKLENYKNLKEEAASPTSYEENGSQGYEQKFSSGNLIVIDLGQDLDSFERLTLLNVDETGAMIGKALVQLANDCDVPQEIIHVVAQGVAAHVAGAAGDEYTRLTGHKLRRITALDPSEILVKNSYVLSGLARGDAEFVDAIHTSTYGLGTLTRVGDIDFYPNGPCTGVPGADNVIEASMRATHFFAESVLPGNERNFPAVEANSLKQYKSNNGFGKRAFMGIDTDFDLKGDYMLLVNEKSPFGNTVPIYKQTGYHSMHEAWRQY